MTYVHYTKGPLQYFRNIHVLFKVLLSYSRY